MLCLLIFNEVWFYDDEGSYVIDYGVYIGGYEVWLVCIVILKLLLLKCFIENIDRIEIGLVIVIWYVFVMFILISENLVYWSFLYCMLILGYFWVVIVICCLM